MADSTVEMERTPAVHLDVKRYMEYLLAISGNNTAAKQLLRHWPNEATTSSARILDTTSDKIVIIFNYDDSLPEGERDVEHRSTCLRYVSPEVRTRIVLLEQQS